jgi:hypothetical protein
MKNSARAIVMTALLVSAIVLWLPGLRSQRVAAQSAGLKGSYGFSASTTYTGGNNSGGLALVGVLSFDGSGNATGSETVVQPDSSPSATTVQSFVIPLTGTYTVNGDGTGIMNLTPGVPNATPDTVSFVLTDGGSAIMFVQSAGGNFLLTGTARKQ